MNRTTIVCYVCNLQRLRTLFTMWSNRPYFIVPSPTTTNKHSSQGSHGYKHFNIVPTYCLSYVVKHFSCFRFHLFVTIKHNIGRCNVGASNSFYQHAFPFFPWNEQTELFVGAKKKTFFEIFVCSAQNVIALNPFHIRTASNATRFKNGNL